MFTIYIEDLKIEAIIGILDFEREKPQLIIAKCKIKYKRDDEDFINYAQLSSMIESMLIENKYELIEDALDEIIEKILEKFKSIKSIKLKLSKPNIIDNCIVGVESFRKF